MKLTQTLIAVTKPKEAALYAKYVIPVAFALESGHEDVTGQQDSHLNNLLPPEVLAENNSYNMLRSFLLGDYTEEQRSKYSSSSATVPFEQYMGFHVRGVCHDLVSKNPGTYAFFDSKHTLENGNSTDLFISTMMHLNLIDASKMSWEQIYEIRKDPISRRRLHRLRQIFEQDYRGKAISFIEDDILTRIDDYSQVIKDWRLETRIGLIEQLISSKTLLSVMAGSIVAVATGSPMLAGSAVLAGGSLEFAKITIEYCKRRHKLDQRLRDLPVGYLIDTQKSEFEGHNT